MKYISTFILGIILIVSACKKQTVTEIIETRPPVLTANYTSASEAVNGYYSAVPFHYNLTKIEYPLIICIHGGGQFGSDASDLQLILHDGIPELLKQKAFPANFIKDGKNYSFIIIAPQFKRYPDNQEVLTFINYIKHQYRIDSTRVYMSGLSAGGIITSDVAAEYPFLFTAIIPISGISIWPDLSIKAENIAKGNLPVWAFHNEKDAVIEYSATNYFVELVNSFKPKTAAKITRFLPFGLYNHDAWTRATDPNFRENGMNIYEWMLQYRR